MFFSFEEDEKKDETATNVTREVTLNATNGSVSLGGLEQKQEIDRGKFLYCSFDLCLFIVYSTI